MKSNIRVLGKDLSCLVSILDEVEKVSAYNNLEGKNALRLRLLAEELCGMLPGLINNFSGEFWAENDGNAYSLHVVLSAADMDAATKESLLALSADGRNIAAKGIMGMIRDVVEDMLFNDSIYNNVDYTYVYSMGNVSISPYFASGFYGSGWSLDQFKTAAEENQDAQVMEDMERSIVANLADDILVGVRGKHVEIVIKKAF